MAVDFFVLPLQQVETENVLNDRDHWGWQHIPVGQEQQRGLISGTWDNRRGQSNESNNRSAIMTTTQKRLPYPPSSVTGLPDKDDFAFHQRVYQHECRHSSKGQPVLPPKAAAFASKQVHDL